MENNTHMTNHPCIAANYFHPTSFIIKQRHSRIINDSGSEQAICVDLNLSCKKEKFNTSLLFMF